MQKTVFIYALNCPTTGRTRYIGKAANPQKRFIGHLKKSRKACHCKNWIQSLITKGLLPVLEILDEVTESEWPQWEVAYIEYFRESGFDLVNGNSGGEGGHNPSEETRRKIGISRLGKPLSLTARKKIGAAHRGRKHSAEMRAKCRIAKGGKNHHFFGKKMSPEFCNKLSASHSTSGFIGVSRHKVTGKWQANYQRSYLGIFAKIEDAILARTLAVALSWHPKNSVANTSGFAGVGWDKSRNKWSARFQEKHIGRFSKIEDAIFARALTIDKYGNR